MIVAFLQNAFFRVGAFYVFEIIPQKGHISLFVGARIKQLGIKKHFFVFKIEFTQAYWRAGKPGNMVKTAFKFVDLFTRSFRSDHEVHMRFPFERFHRTGYHVMTF